MDSSFLSASFAKINLMLHIVGKRQDGFHLLESLVVFTRFSDTISVRKSKKDTLSISGAFTENIPCDRSNLVWKAYDLLRDSIPLKDKLSPVFLSLEKNIPVQAGLGGGSANAAVVLQLLNRLWNLNYDDAYLQDLGSRLGADVPMCLAAHPLIARGIGENLELIPNFPSLFLVLVNSGDHVSTPQVFSLFSFEAPSLLPPLPDFWNFEICVSWLKLCRNDLFYPALKVAPSIQEALNILDHYGSCFSSMSGSGATCFGLFPSLEKAQQAAGLIQKQKRDWFVVATQTV